MRKIFVAVLCGLLMNFAPLPVTAEAAIVADKPDVEFCGYKLFAERQRELQRQREKYSDADDDEQPAAPPKYPPRDAETD